LGKSSSRGQKRGGKFLERTAKADMFGEKHQGRTRQNIKRIIWWKRTCAGRGNLPYTWRGRGKNRRKVDI